MTAMEINLEDDSEDEEVQESRGRLSMNPKTAAAAAEQRQREHLDENDVDDNNNNNNDDDDDSPVKFGLKSAVWLHLGQHLDATLLALSSNSSSSSSSSTTTAAITLAQANGKANTTEQQQQKQKQKPRPRERYNMNPHFCASLTQLVCTQIELAALDMEAFARHAGRTTITGDDVFLLARRNEDLQRMLKGASSSSSFSFS